MRREEGGLREERRGEGEIVRGKEVVGLNTALYCRFCFNLSVFTVVLN